MTAFAIDVTDRGGVAVLELRGELDLHSAPELREALVGVIGDARRVVVDLERLTFIDSVGLGMLVSGLKRARACGGELELACANRTVMRPIELTGLDAVFTIHATRDAAVRD